MVIIDFGRAEDLAKSYNRVFVYDGLPQSFHRRRYGSQADSLQRTRFVDMHTESRPGGKSRQRRSPSAHASAVERLSMWIVVAFTVVPLLFMGEEYGERRPFPFFCSFSDAGLIEAVRRGRRESLPLCDSIGPWNPDPQSPETFLSAETRLGMAGWVFAGETRRLDQIFWRPGVIGRCSATGNTKLRSTDADLDDQDGGFSFCFFSAAARTDCWPWQIYRGKRVIFRLLLAGKHVLLSTEDVRYGGSRLECRSLDRLLPYELLVLGGGKSLPWTIFRTGVKLSRMLVGKMIEDRRCHPLATYRLEFSKDRLTFRDAAAIVPYLDELGISHIYASPYLKTQSGVVMAMP